MAKLTENESVLILDSMRKYRGIVRFTDTPKSTIQEIDQLVDKMTSQLNTSKDAIKQIRDISKEAEGRNGHDCQNCE